MANTTKKASTGAVSRMKWMPNTASKTCTICESPFTTISRRHHCRGCGALVCAACSPQRFNFKEEGHKPSRACNPCAALVTAANKRNASMKEAAEAGIPHSLLLVGVPLKGRFTGTIDEAGRPHGAGSFIGADGMVYEGSWVAGEFTGKGTLHATAPLTGGLTSKKLSYKGDWVNASFHGKGELYHSDGKQVRYRGSWLNDKRHGEGTSYHKDGSEEHCTGSNRMSRWDNGTFVEGLGSHY
jgi:hypothetical protein